MPLLPSLIRRIDEFFKVAEHYSLVSLGADDTKLVAELSKAAQQTLNPEVSYNLRVLAAMYNKALEMNGGFNTIYKAIQGMVEDMDPDEEETESVEDLLNQIASSIKARAARPDSPGDMRELQMAGSAARTEDSPFSYEEPEEEEEDVSAYEASLLGYGGGQFDMTGGVNQEAAQSGTGRGYSVGKARSLKDWAALYANEADKYNEDLNGSSSLLTPASQQARQNPKVRANLEALIKVLGVLSKLTIDALKIQNQIDIETEIAHPKEEAQLADIRLKLSAGERERRLLKRSLSKFYKENELGVLQGKLTAPMSGQERRILQEKIKLQELRTSGKYGYGKEAQERTRLINALTADPNLSDEQFKKMEEAINGAAQFTDRITKAQYDRIRTVQKTREEEGREAPTAAPMRGGGRIKKPQVDFDTASYPTLLKRFRELNNTITSDAKKYVARSGKEKGDDKMQPYVEAVSMAIKRKDQAAKFTAINALKAAIKETLVSDASLRGYLWSIRLAPHFKTIEEFLYNIKSKQNASGVWNLSESERDMLRTAAAQINRMYDIYTKYFPEKGGRYGRSHYMTSVKFYPSLVKYIYDNILQEEQPSLETTAQSLEDMLNKKSPQQSKRETDRMLTKQKGREQMREDVPEYAPTKGGGRVSIKNLEYPMQPDFELATFLGLINELQTRFNSDFTRLKQRVSRPVDGGDPQFKPFVDALASAIVKKNNQAKYEAIQKIREISADHLRRDERSPLIKFARLMPHFRKLRGALKTIAKWQGPTNNDYRLTPNDQFFISSTIDLATRLSDLISQHFKNINLEPTKSILATIIQYLEYVKTQGPLQ